MEEKINPYSKGPMPVEPSFSIGQHIGSGKGIFEIHGIITKIDINWWGYVYCINRKDVIGKACICEKDAHIHESKSETKQIIKEAKTKQKSQIKTNSCSCRTCKK